MTTFVPRQSWLRRMWEFRPRVLKVTSWSPHGVEEYVVAWGGRWRFRVRPEPRPS